jgi:hypothetical protein
MFVRNLARGSSAQTGKSVSAGNNPEKAMAAILAARSDCAAYAVPGRPWAPHLRALQLKTEGD